MIFMLFPTTSALIPSKSEPSYKTSSNLAYRVVFLFCKGVETLVLVLEGGIYFYDHLLKDKYFLCLHNETEVSLGPIGFYVDSELQIAGSMNVWLLKSYLIMCEAGLRHNPFASAAHLIA